MRAGQELHEARSMDRYVGGRDSQTEACILPPLGFPRHKAFLLPSVGLEGAGKGRLVFLIKSIGRFKTDKNYKYII